MKSFFHKLNKAFELKLGWFFINGRKLDDWQKYLNDKYNTE